MILRRLIKTLFLFLAFTLFIQVQANPVKLRVKSNIPHASVFLDGIKVGGVLASIDVNSGKYKLRVAAPGYVAKAKFVEFKNSAKMIEINLNRRKKKKARTTTRKSARAKGARAFNRNREKLDCEISFQGDNKFKTDYIFLGEVRGNDLSECLDKGENYINKKVKNIYLFFNYTPKTVCPAYEGKGPKVTLEAKLGNNSDTREINSLMGASCRVMFIPEE